MSLYTQEEIDKYFQGKPKGGTPLYRAKKFEQWRYEWKDNALPAEGNAASLKVKRFVVDNKIPRCDWSLKHTWTDGSVYYFRHREDSLAAVLTLI